MESTSTPQPRPRLDAARRTFRRERTLTLVGALGLLATAVCVVAMAFYGTSVAPEGSLDEAAKFAFGVAIFTLTMALLLPLTGWSVHAKRAWRTSYCTFAVYGLIVEPAQALRGLDPRFSDEHTRLDTIAGIVFGVTAGVAALTFLALAVRFFRDGVMTDRPLLRMGIRYGAVAVLVSFLVPGVLMSIRQGREIAGAGDLMPAHMIGVHGIQAVPITALILAWSAPARRVIPAMHVAGVGWTGAAIAAALQAFAGFSPFAVSPFSAATVAGLAVWGVVTLYGSVAVWGRWSPANRAGTA